MEVTKRFIYRRKALYLLLKHTQKYRCYLFNYYYRLAPEIEAYIFIKKNWRAFGIRVQPNNVYNLKY